LNPIAAKLTTWSDNLLIPKVRSKTLTMQLHGLLVPTESHMKKKNIYIYMPKVVGKII
jgi:hypothetical protein